MKNVFKVKTVINFKNDAMEEKRGIVICSIKRFRYVNDNDEVSIVSGFMVQADDSTDIISIPYWRIKSFG